MFDPGLNQGDLFGGQTALFGEVAMTRFGEPRGHEAGAGDVGNLQGVVFYVFITEQRKRSGFAGTVTRSAVGIDDRGDVAVERDLGRRGGGGWCSQTH